MRRHIIMAALLSNLFLFNNASALPLNSYFQQGITVTNLSSRGIWITDTTDLPFLNDYPLSSGYELTGTYASNQFTIPSGQTFSHTINIIGAQFICTVTSHLFLSTTSTIADRPTSSNETKCDTSIYQSYGRNGTVYGFRITVRD